MGKARQLTTLPIAGAFIGTIVGAGFATGQEVLQFFTLFGRKSFIGIALATILFCYFGLEIMRISRELKADSHQELVRYTLGRRLGRLMDWFITLSFLGVLIVMAAGSGAVTEEQLGLSSLHGSLVVIILAFLTVISGVNNVIRAIAFVVPFLLIGVLGVTIFSVLHDPLTIQKIVILESLESPITKNWTFAGLLYVSYNILLAVAVLSSLGVEAQNRRCLLWGGVLGGMGLGAGILAINIAIMSSVPAILPFQVPMIFLAKGLNSQLALAYGFILLLEIYTTAVSILYGVVARLAHTNIQKVFWAGIASLGAIMAAQLGFARLITTIYPLLGFIGLLFIASILLTRPREFLSGL
jgi:uncharacterized membrane protein YkvI